MSELEPFRRQVHPLRGLAYNLRRLVAPRSQLDIELPRQHLRFRLPVESIFARLLYKYGEYEPHVSNYLIAHARRLGEGLFIDVGANFGWYACLLSALDRERRVLAFEPEPGNYALLQAQLALNGAHGVEPLNLGLGAEAGRLLLHKYKAGNSGRHSLLPLHDGERVEVAIVTLDQQLAARGLAEHPIALVKMDIEGYELFALRGAEQALARTRRLILEFSPLLMRQAGLDPDALLELVQRHGFRARVFDAVADVVEPRPVGYDELRALGRQERQFDLLFEAAPDREPSP